MSRFILILTTVNKEEKAKEIASKLVEERLSACVTVTSPATSFYWWEGKINKEQEYILLIKTKKDMYKKIEERLRELHPYETPEIIVLPIIKGFKEYFSWINEEVI